LSHTINLLGEKMKLKFNAIGLEFEADVKLNLDDFMDDNQEMEIQKITYKKETDVTFLLDSDCSDKIIFAVISAIKKEIESDKFQNLIDQVQSDDFFRKAGIL
jgi:hypothetical protein